MVQGWDDIRRAWQAEDCLCVPLYLRGSTCDANDLAVMEHDDLGIIFHLLAA